MRHVFYWIGAVLAALTFAMLYVQFLIGDDDRAVRDRLADWYVAIEGGDWSRLVGFAVSSTERFLSYLFGSRIVSLRFIFLAGAISLIVNSIVMREVQPIAIKAGMPAGLTLCIVAANALMDVVALATTRWYMRRIARRERVRIMLDLGVMLAIAYLTVGVALDLGSAFFEVSLGRWNLNPVQYAFLAIGWLPTSTYLWLSGSVTRTAFLAGLALALPAAFSTITLLSIYLGSVFVYITRGITQHPLGRTVEQLASVKTGVVPTVVGGLSAASVLVGYFK